MRPGLVFVGIVFVAAIAVFLLAVTQFTSDAFVWTVHHLDYAAFALLWVARARGSSAEGSRGVADELSTPPVGELVPQTFTGG